MSIFVVKMVKFIWQRHYQKLDLACRISMHTDLLILNSEINVLAIIAGYTIPKGWKVFASFRAVHLDHDHFKAARTFNPWRWQQVLSYLSWYPTGICL